MSGDLWGFVVAVVVCLVFGLNNLMCLRNVSLLVLVATQINMARKEWFLI